MISTVLRSVLLVFLVGVHTAWAFDIQIAARGVSVYFPRQQTSPSQSEVHMPSAQGLLAKELILAAPKATIHMRTFDKANSEPRTATFDAENLSIEGRNLNSGVLSGSWEGGRLDAASASFESDQTLLQAVRLWTSNMSVHSSQATLNRSSGGLWPFDVRFYGGVTTTIQSVGPVQGEMR